LEAHPCKKLPSTAAITVDRNSWSCRATAQSRYLPASGAIRFAIFKESLGLQVGRAEHRWAFLEDGATG
jgi:hypothetical protein